MAERFKEALNVFRKDGGILRMSEAVEAGISRRTLYATRDEGGARAAQPRNVSARIPAGAGGT